MRSIEKTVITASILFLILFTGCISYTNFQTPDTSPTLQFNGGAGLSVCFLGGVDTSGYYYGDIDQNMTYSGECFPLFVRLGLADNLDLGLRYIFPLDGAIDLKYKIMDSPVMISPSIGVGGLWAGWGISDGFDTTYTPTSLMERFDLTGRVIIGKRLGAFTVYGFPMIQRSAYYVLDKTRVTYHGEFIREEIEHEARNTFYQYGGGAGFAVWRFIAEVDYVYSNEFQSIQVGVGFRSDR